MEFRIATAADAPGIHEIYAPVVRTSPASFETTPPDVAEIARRVENVLARYPWLVAVEGDRVLAYVYGTEHRARAAYRWSVEVSAYVHADARRRGLATGLYRVLFRLLARQRYARAFAGITLPNDASVALHESLGFRKVGVYSRIGHKLGAWHDVGWWERDLATPSAGDPEEPIPFATYRTEPDVARELARRD
ncbi:MAG: arsinothricin resistance N-acetyltransferase ArsN1 family B [bacterium]